MSMRRSKGEASFYDGGRKALARSLPSEPCVRPTPLKSEHSAPKEQSVRPLAAPIEQPP